MPRSSLSAHEYAGRRVAAAQAGLYHRRSAGRSIAESAGGAVPDGVGKGGPDLERLGARYPLPRGCSLSATARVPAIRYRVGARYPIASRDVGSVPLSAIRYPIPAIRFRSSVCEALSRYPLSHSRPLQFANKIDSHRLTPSPG